MQPRPEEMVLALARRLEQLGEPYRENALRWLEHSLARRLERLPEDLLEVLRDPPPAAAPSDLESAGGAGGRGALLRAEPELILQRRQGAKTGRPRETRGRLHVCPFSKGCAQAASADRACL